MDDLFWGLLWMKLVLRTPKVFANCAENVLGDLVICAPGDGGC